MYRAPWVLRLWCGGETGGGGGGRHNALELGWKKDEDNIYAAATFFNFPQWTVSLHATKAAIILVYVQYNIILTVLVLAVPQTERWGQLTV